MTDAAYLHLDAVSKRYGASLAVAEVSLAVGRGEMVALLGPSGCGKTTTLRMIAGFAEPSSGRIMLDGQSLAGRPPYLRQMGIVFQSYALFPHLTVAANIAFGLEMRGLPRTARHARVEEMLRLVRLEALAGRLPRELSGGQQQRVALARALAIEPKALLLDEPLSNLDAALRGDMAREIRLLQRRRGLTTVIVTHDQAEAMAMADRLIVMRDGRVQQAGTQEDLYERPANAFVATFIGQSNTLRGVLENGALLRLESGTRIALAEAYAGQGSCTLALRPERIALRPVEGAAGNVQGTVSLASYLGAVAEHVVMLDEAVSVVVQQPSAGPGAGPRFAAGDRVTLNWTLSGERLFGGDGSPCPPGECAPSPILQGATNDG